ncbi:MAG: methylmalonyl-CoA mutase family protein [Thermotogota bacterium]|nr:methylmalonyl-CoA mutase family protein [Thermotogota bacterium]
MENDEKQRLFEDFDSSTYEQWKEAAEKLLKGVPFDKKMYTHTPEGVRLEPIYNLEDGCPASNENFPGYFRFRRSTKETGYLNPAWTIMQEESEPIPQKWNESCLTHLMKGVDGINVRLNSLSKDCQLPESSEDCCLKGLSVTDFEDFKGAFDSVKLTEYPLYMDCGINTEIYLALFYALKGEKIKKMKGTLGTDPLGRLVETGKIKASFDEVFDSIVRMIKWKKDKASELKTILIDTTPYHNAGASGVEELSIAFSTAVYYINKLLDRGLAIDEIANEITFSFSVASYFFMEIAKLRAARILWTTIVEAYGGQKESGKISIHARTSSRTQTIYDPYVNMLRDTSQAFSAILGGVDSLHVSPFEERKGLNSAFSKRVAKNVQLILKEECHLTMPIDPTGGTWYIEKVTDELSQKVWERFQQIEENGGIIEYYHQGLAEADIEKSRNFRQKEFTTRKRGIVGNNMYPNLFEEPLSVDSDQKRKVQEQLFNSIQDVKGQSDDFLSVDTPVKIEELSEKLKTGASLQTLSKTIFKGSTSAKSLEPHHDAELFELLRQTSCNIKTKTGELPKVFCANFSKLAVHKPRTGFTKGFFEVGGFDVLAQHSFETVEEAVDKALASKAKIVVICSSDKVYPEVVVPFTEAIKAKDHRIKVILAGKPDQSLADDYEKAGLDDFIFVKTDVYDFLKKAQEWVREQGGEGLNKSSN